MKTNVFDTIKVYQFYLNNELYAYTMTKEYKSMFLSQRNQKVFDVIVVEMDELELGAFMSRYPNKKLCKIVINETLNEYLTVIGTNEESFNVTDRADKIEEYISQTYKEIELIPLKKKYKKAINSISKIFFLTDAGGDRHYVSTINQLAIFTELAKKTL